MKENNLSENGFLYGREKSSRSRRMPRTWFIALRQFAYKNPAAVSLGHDASPVALRPNTGGVASTLPL